MASFDFFAKAYQLERQGEPFATATVVRVERPTSGRPGDRAIVTLDGELHGWIGGSCSRPTVVKEALAALREGRSRLIRLSSEPGDEAGRQGLVDLSMTCFSGGTMEIFIEPHLQVRLLIVGDQPVGRALAGFGKLLGYRVVGAPEPGGEGSLVAADELLSGLEEIEAAITPLTCVVVATHGVGDELALEHSLGRGAPYVGLVASKKRTGSIRRYLKKRGFGDDELEALNAPAGLDIGAQRPEEIAVSILAQIVETLRTAGEIDWNAGADDRESDEDSSTKTAIDPICGMTVDIADARHVHEYNGYHLYFCGRGCLAAFTSDPDRYLEALTGPSV